MEIVGWILLSLLVLILLVLFVPVRIKLELLDTVRVRVYLFGCIRVFSMAGDQPPKPEKQQKPAAQEPPPENAPPEKAKPSLMEEIKALKQREGVGGVLSFFKRLLAIATGALRGIIRFVTVRRLSLCVRVGGEEADQIAKTYGTISAALFPTLAALSKVLRIRKQRVLVQPDFLSDSMLVRMRMILWVWPFGVAGAAIGAFFKFIAAWFQVLKAPRNGASDTVQTTSQSK